MSLSPMYRMDVEVKEGPLHAKAAIMVSIMAGKTCKLVTSFNMFMVCVPN